MRNNKNCHCTFFIHHFHENPNWNRYFKSCIPRNQHFICLFVNRFFNRIRMQDIKIFKYKRSCWNSGLFTIGKQNNFSITQKSHLFICCFFSHYFNILCHLITAAEHKVNKHSGTPQATRGTKHHRQCPCVSSASSWLRLATGPVLEVLPVWFSLIFSATNKPPLLFTSPSSELLSTLLFT